MAERQHPTVELETTCACGAVLVAVKGPIYSMFLCACADCQKATGTGHATVALADPGSLAITGETRSFSRPAASGATFTRYFCPACGTPLYGRSSRAERSVMLPVGLFGPDTAWFAPTRLIFARSHRDWDTLADGLPRHDTYPERGRS